MSRVLTCWTWLQAMVLGHAMMHGNNEKWLFGEEWWGNYSQIGSCDDEGPFKCCAHGENALRNPPWDTSKPLTRLTSVSTVASLYEFSHLKTRVNQGPEKTTLALCVGLGRFAFYCFVLLSYVVTSRMSLKPSGQICSCQMVSWNSPRSWIKLRENYYLLTYGNHKQMRFLFYIF